MTSSITRLELDDAEWDRALVGLGGHPLQSAHWGRARERVDGRAYVAVAAARDSRPIWLARAEIRRLPLLGTAAWIPRGPTMALDVSSECAADCMGLLSAQGFALSLGNPWGRASETEVPSRAARTIWIDLTRGRESLWKGLQKNWRHGVGYARRAGVTVEETRDPVLVRAFFELCASVSKQKGFPLPASEALMRTLLEGPTDAPVCSHLFLAHGEERLAAGAFVIRCGTNIHYFWGATDRQLSRLRPGEALQWAIIEWGIGQGCSTYDLEGVDPVSNAGTYEFKKKMGGEEIRLRPTEVTGLNWLGRVVAPVVALSQRR